MCLDAKLASFFLLLAIDRVISGNTPAAFIARARILISLATCSDFDDNFLTYPTVGVLLQIIAIVSPFTGTLAATNINAATRPRASSSKFITSMFLLS